MPPGGITDRRPAEGKETAGGRKRNYSVSVPEVSSSEIDLRGLRGEEAVAQLGRFIEHALLNGVPEISIIHGKGTGRLQEAVSRYLGEHSRVERFSHAPLEQGGAGMTRARLAV